MSARDTIEIPDVILERYRLDELPREEANRVGRLLRESETLQRRLDALDQSDADVARQYPPAWLAARVRERLGHTGHAPDARGTARQWGLAVAMGLAAIALVAALPRLVLWPTGQTTIVDPDRIKGLKPSLAVYRRTDRGTETLADGDIARKGDLLRLGYTAAGQSHGVIVSLDGRGAVTLHLPPNGTRAAALGRDGTILLDQAYELDDAPGWERFYFVTGEAPFDVAPIMEAARRAAAGDLRAPPAALPIPRALSQFAFSLQKEVKP
jgi:hypothetical protein